jgi:hypothetical protein
MSIALRILFVACFVAPLIVAALRAPRAGVAGAWYAATLLVAILGAQANPLAVGLLRVDDTLLGNSLCGVGWRVAPARR